LAEAGYRGGEEGVMGLRLKVPVVWQDKSMSCWYASACMVAYYFEAGPRLGLPKQYAANTGINPNLGEIITLAKAEHLEAVLASNRNWTEVGLERTLRDFGPIWAAGFWYGSGHAVVVTGVDGNKVFLNDPDGGVEKEGTLGWFNQKLGKMWPDCMLRRSESKGGPGIAGGAPWTL
jgi:hypothetical protein